MKSITHFCAIAIFNRSVAELAGASVEVFVSLGFCGGTTAFDRDVAVVVATSLRADVVVGEADGELPAGSWCEWVKIPVVEV